MEILLRTFFGTPRRALWSSGFLGLCVAFAALLPEAAQALATNVGLVVYHILDRIVGVIIAILLPIAGPLVGIALCVFFFVLMWRKIFSSP